MAYSSWLVDLVCAQFYALSSKHSARNQALSFWSTLPQRKRMASVTSWDRGLLSFALTHQLKIGELTCNVKEFHAACLISESRQAIYKRGGIVSITTRILIIDMLLDRIPVADLTGIVVMHAEDVTPTSMEAFVMRVYREKNKVNHFRTSSRCIAS